jgi:hypothetical protein
LLETPTFFKSASNIEVHSAPAQQHHAQRNSFSVAGAGGAAGGGSASAKMLNFRDDSIRCVAWRALRVDVCVYVVVRMFARFCVCV